MLALVWTAVFDAWSRYDDKARPVYLQNVERVTLKERTLKNKETSNMAGISRVLGGYHIQCENEEGLKMGRGVAVALWKKYLYYTGQIM
jgi:hypothetical protein